jgi:unsaturated chondroitin disaccharide hydrolase
VKTVVTESKLNHHPDALKFNSSLSRAFDLCVRKTRSNIKQLADDPKSAALAVDGNYFNFKEGFYEIGNWTSSFFTGMALLAWRKTEEEFFLQQVLRLAPHYREKVFTHHRDTHHDLGFLYSLYSVMLYQLTGDQEHREVGLRAAEVLAQRFNPVGNFIRAWGHMDTTEYDNMAIIDCLMNLPLLYWASNETSDDKYRDIAVRHADMALKNLVRPDGSVYHAYRFDLKTEKPLGGDTYGGCAVESHWARGTAWAIYGFALSYRYTNHEKYLDAALRITRKFNQELDGDEIPVWDFRLPPGEAPLRDSSAAAVVVCGYQELQNLGVADALITKTKESLLYHLCSDAYLNFDESCPGILKYGQIGLNGAALAQNAYTSWGDYYLMEALARELFQAKTTW